MSEDNAINGEQEVVVLALKEESITLTVNTHTVELEDGKTGECKTTSLVMPINADLLIAEYGYVGLMELLNSVRQKKPIAIAGALCIVGKGHNVPPMFKIGTKVIPANNETYVLRPAFDPNNHYSFDFLSKQAEKDPHLLAAVSIANEKDHSRMGLNMEATVISPDVIKEAEGMAARKNMGNLLFKDKGVVFVNYKLTNYNNIGAFIV